MTRRAGITVSAGVVLAAGLFVIVGGAPAVLRRVELFRVREVEIVGLRYLAPESVLAVLRLDPAPRANVFQDLDGLADRVRRMPGVEDATVRRRLPGVLEVRVTEVVPVAFVPTGRGLTVVDGEGRPLPFDPSRASAPLDLPVAGSTDPDLLGLLGRVAAVDPALFAQVTIARRAGSRGTRDCVLELGSRRVWLRPDA